MTQKNQNTTSATSALSDPNIKVFVENLVAEKKFTDVEEEVIVQIKKDLTDRVEEIINAAILAAMPAGRLEDFDKLLHTGTGQEIAAFCETNVPNLQEIVTEELRAFRETYLGI